MTHELDVVDIYSNSWGPSDDGNDVDEIPTLVHEALEYGVTEVFKFLFLQQSHMYHVS